jgi:hypothetical protein
MRASEELLAMRELLAGPGAWTQGELARDVSGLMAPTYSDRARCFCVQGASMRCGISDEADEYICKAIGVEVWTEWALWNDDPSRTHLEVVEMIERAAVAALASEGSEG